MYGDDPAWEVGALHGRREEASKVTHLYQPIHLYGCERKSPSRCPATWRDALASQPRAARLLISTPTRSFQESIVYSTCAKPSSLHLAHMHTPSLSHISQWPFALSLLGIDCH
ncbi:hypothetical protein TIFTF001_023957 [Ficus carica]|uniref:Uncharacterized protein n=1 Tax=Ficus carica TaxID=3494 RepID=A0AA88ALU0_FICCA|nr:hypothetical protein TIFTF001_023957 [Ficus carica]